MNLRSTIVGISLMAIGAPAPAQQPACNNDAGDNPVVIGPRDRGVRIEVVRSAPQVGIVTVYVASQGRFLIDGESWPPHNGTFGYSQNNPDLFEAKPGARRTVSASLRWAGDNGKIAIAPSKIVHCRYDTGYDELHFWLNPDPTEPIHYRVRFNWVKKG